MFLQHTNIESNMLSSRILSSIRLPLEKDVPLYLVRFFMIGIVGILLPVSHSFFMYITPLVLMGCLAMILFYELTATRKRGTSYFITFSVTVYLVSLVVEMVGVNTGVLFGQYRYGATLGWQVAHTPLIIGVNWLILMLGAASISSGLSSFMGFSGTRYVDTIFRIFTGAFLAVSLDFLLERVAPWMDMWSWETARIPGRNYLTWLILSIIFQSYYVLGKIQQRTVIAGSLFVLLFLFFLLLFFYLMFV